MGKLDTNLSAGDSTDGERLDKQPWTQNHYDTTSAFVIKERALYTLVNRHHPNKNTDILKGVNKTGESGHVSTDIVSFQRYVLCIYSVSMSYVTCFQTLCMSTHTTTNG